MTAFDRRLWLGAVLRALDKRPAGEKPRVGELARQLGLTQADVIATVETLIAEQRLDPATLRSPDRDSQAVPPPATPPAEERSAGGTSRDPTGPELADRLSAFVARHGLAKSRVGIHLFGFKGGIEHLRRRQHPQPATIAKAVDFLAWPPPLEPFRVIVARRPAKGRVASLPRGLTGDQQAAAHRRGVTRQAERLLDGDASALTSGGRINQGVRAAMNNIQHCRDVAARAADPVEQAKLALRRRGRVVVDANVMGGRANRFMVSGQRDDAGKALQLTGGELIALAQRINPQFFTDRSATR